MRDYIEVTGKSEDDAISKGLARLGLDRDDVSVEVIERAKSGFLGLGGSPAKVRLYYGQEREETASAPAEQEEPPRREEPAVERQAPSAASRAPGAPEKKDPPAPKKAEPAPVKSAPSRESAPAGTERPPFVPVDNGEEVDDEKAREIKTFLSGLLRHMESSAVVKVYQPEKGRYKVILEGQGLGALIGRRGETLDAIQQITSYAVNRSGGSRVRIQLDAENYRAKREDSLRHLAKKVAAKVAKYRRSVTLEPMNAYERHVIHTALQDEPGITTYSTGTDPNRRVIVACDREKR